MILNPENGLAMKGRKIILGYVPKEKLILGVKYPEAYDLLEKVLNVEIKSYLSYFLKH